MSLTQWLTMSTPMPRCAPGGDGDLDLGAHAVGAGREVAAARQRVQAGERADADRHLLAVRGGDERLDPLQHALVSLDVDAGRGVRQPFGAHQLWSTSAATAARGRGRTSPAARTASCPSRAAAAPAPGTSRRSRRGRTPPTCRARSRASDPGSTGTASESAPMCRRTSSTDRPDGDQLLGRADVDAHEAREAHRRAGDPHVDLAWRRPRAGAR